MKHRNPLDQIAPNTSLPFFLRLRWGWGTVLTFVLGGGALFLACTKDGIVALHGIWISGILLLGYLFVKDHFRMRIALEELASRPSSRTGDPIVHFRSGQRPNSLDFQFRPDDNATKAVGSQVCQTSVIENEIKITRPHPRGRYIGSILHYESGALIPSRNRVTRRIHVGFEYRSPGGSFTIGIRLRDRKGGWIKDTYGEWCLVKMELNGAEWTPSPPALLVPGNSQQELKVSLEVLPENNPPGPDTSLFLLDSHKFSLAASSSETGVFLQQFHVQGSHFLDDLKQRFVVG